MEVKETNLDGVLIIKPKVFGDKRGFFKETYQYSKYRDAGIDFKFVQDNFSRSRKGVLRGLHFQNLFPQGKLVSCSRGAVFDVAVDINPLSPTCGQYVGVVLSEDNHEQLWVPPGFAHGFCVLTDEADFQYKCTDLYNPEDEGGIIWNDKDININWPVSDVVLSQKDKMNQTLEEFLCTKSKY